MRGSNCPTSTSRTSTPRRAAAIYRAACRMAIVDHVFAHAERKMLDRLQTHARHPERHRARDRSGRPRPRGVMQRRHSIRHLAWRGGVAMVSDAMMFTGLYPLAVHAWRAARGEQPPQALRIALAEWGMALALSALRPAGFWPLPGATTRGPRPIIVLHGYAMNRANFVVLARRLAAAGLGPISASSTGRWAASRRARASSAGSSTRCAQATGADEVDLVGHSMGGVVARYYLALGGGDVHVRHLVTLGSPHAGTDVSAVGIGHASRELIAGSQARHAARARHRRRATRRSRRSCRKPTRSCRPRRSRRSWGPSASSIPISGTSPCSARGEWHATSSRG